MNAAKTLRLPPLATLIEWAARVGYGARGFVYLSAGALTLLAATDRIGDAVGTSGAAGWLAEQPFGKVWLVLLGLGLWAFVGWRVLQAVFDADHEGTDLKGWTTRAGQAVSGLFYGVLASGVFEYLDEFQFFSDVLIWLAAIITLWTGWQYFSAAQKQMRDL